MRRAADIPLLRAAFGRPSRESQAIDRLQGLVEALSTQLEAIEQKLEPEPLTAQVTTPAEAEIAACRAISDRSIFIIGTGRSGTTITAELINASHKALLLTEADVFMPGKPDNFRDWYVEQHISFGNQVSKSSYAPNFYPRSEHTWWEWFTAAAEAYERVGDKMAFTAYHLDLAPPQVIRSFFEARFFSASYVFTIRDPVQTLLSIAHMFRLNDDHKLRPQIIAWLQVVQLWADFIRTFPRVLTLLTDTLDGDTVHRLGAFLELDLSGAELLLDPQERRQHEIGDRYPELAAISERLQEVFSAVRNSLSADPLLMQADQNRSLALNDTRHDPAASISLSPQPIGHAWALAQHLIEELRAVPAPTA